ncbi:MAG: hypothetical protein JJT89_07385, partial [Nitriliruptoraceae bacterium]|nr:hypothetical protein [Nitriliruptoraceae bacterium]
MTDAPHPARVGVLVSGSGTNLQAVLDDLAAADAPGRVVVVGSDKPDAGGLARAEAAGEAPHAPPRVRGGPPHARGARRRAALPPP